MYARPAGLSDDDEVDDDGFSFHDEVQMKRSFVKYPTNSSQGKDVSEEKTCNSRNEEVHKLQLELIQACMIGNIYMIDDYVRLGYDPNDFLNTGWTPLLYAASCVCPKSIEYLLGLGVDVNKDKDGYTPLMALCNSSKGTSNEFFACFQLFIEAKCDPNAKDKNNDTALMFACKMREPEVIKELLKHVDNVNFADNDGVTALFYAVMGNKPETVKILLENKAVVAIKNRHNDSPRDIAVAKGFDKIVSILDVESSDVSGVEEPFECVQSYTWRDLFPTLGKMDENSIDYDVSTMLYGMGMERFKFLFTGMDLKTFLNLTEEDLIKLGLDMPYQRREIMQGLHKFHVKNWSANSFSSIRKNMPYTIFDGVVSLGNAAKQIGIIGSSIRFLKNGLVGAKEKNIELNEKQKSQYKGELAKTEETLVSLEKELRSMKSLAKKMQKESTMKPPATYIGPKKKNSNWAIFLSVSLIVGIYLSRSSYVQRILSD